MQNIKRADAVRLLEHIAEIGAQEFQVASLEGRKPADWAVNLKYEFDRYHIDLPRPCNGEAHSNAHIDNCGVCMPRWGWVFADKGYKIP